MTRRRRRGSAYRRRPRESRKRSARTTRPPGSSSDRRWAARPVTLCDRARILARRPGHFCRALHVTVEVGLSYHRLLFVRRCAVSSLYTFRSIDRLGSGLPARRGVPPTLRRFRDIQGPGLDVFRRFPHLRSVLRELSRIDRRGRHDGDELPSWPNHTCTPVGDDGPRRGPARGAYSGARRYCARGGLRRVD